MKGGKQVVRRTFAQERFEILIRKQKAGEATFRDLTELDDIVNRVPDIRLTVLEEMEGKNTPGDDLTEETPVIHHIAQPTLLQKIKLFFDRLLQFNTANLMASDSPF
jgi:hypothetical protein